MDCKLAAWRKANLYRKRPRRHGRIELNDEETEVDDEGGVDGKLDLGGHSVILLQLLLLLIVCAQKLVDEIILFVVVALDSLGISFGMFFQDLFLGDVGAPVASEVERVDLVWQRRGRGDDGTRSSRYVGLGLADRDRFSSDVPMNRARDARSSLGAVDIGGTPAYSHWKGQPWLGPRLMSAEKKREWLGWSATQGPRRVDGPLAFGHNRC